LHKVLVANRGEIAVRVIRACRDLGLQSVAVYSDADWAARHVRFADEACRIGSPPSSDSYLRIDRVVEAARASGADAVHPGYGFLSENATFARVCRDAGLTFIGPSPEAMALMGSKTAARGVAAAAGVPVVPGTAGALDREATDAGVADIAAAIGYPLMVKAVAGGGGKGMRVVGGPEALHEAIRTARSEALAAFGDEGIYLERRLVRPRHIEVQILADAHGTVLPFVERECSIQRRQQKVVEESPSPAVSPALRARLAAAAAAVARLAGYVNAGTIEFLVDTSGDFYFLEMNTRLQVEHPITEAVTGIDLVTWQMRIAAGERLTLDGDALLTPRGHAVECRVYAEDADAGFLPSPGVITALTSPEGPGIRNDSGVDAGTTVTVFYDPLLSKLIAWGEDRPQALARMRRALDEYDVSGVRTSLPFFRWLLGEAFFAAGDFHTASLDEVLQRRHGQPFAEATLSLEEVAAIGAAIAMKSGTLPAVSSGAAPVNDARQLPRATSPWIQQARHDALRHQLL
jgi:acetyl-CoA carboxylase biotin carboxylase subunit